MEYIIPEHSDKTYILTVENDIGYILDFKWGFVFTIPNPL
jgi:hypothetical protein